MTVAIEARNAGLTDLTTLLREQQAQKVDFVVPASKMKAVEGDLVIRGTEPVLTPDGVDLADGTYRPTEVFDEGIAAKLQIPITYLRRLRNRPDLYDVNVNGWLHGRRPKVSHPAAGAEVLREGIPGDGRTFLVRAFRGEDGTGIARALLSNRFRMVDNLDILFAALQGVRDAGVEVDIVGCDLSERRMYVKVNCPQVWALAPELLKGYRSPFSGNTGADNPKVFAGFVIGNSETGNGSWSITPRITFQVCSNGMTLTKDAFAGRHIGARMDDGLVNWGQDTQEAEVNLVALKTRDVIRTTLDQEYLVGKIAELEEKSDHKMAKPDEAVRTVAKKLSFSDEVADKILEFFMESGSINAGGVMNAITAAAQVVDSPDVAADLEAKAFDALALAATL